MKGGAEAPPLLLGNCQGVSPSRRRAAAALTSLAHQSVGDARPAADSVGPLAMQHARNAMRPHRGAVRLSEAIGDQDLANLGAAVW